MYKTIIVGLSLCCLQTSSLYAEDPPDKIAQKSPSAGDEAFSLLKTAKSSRLSAVVQYQPYVDGLKNENQPLIQLKMNDSVITTFLLDSGTNNSIISDELADKLKLQQTPILLQGKPSLFEGNPVNGVILKSVNLGSFRLQDCTFLVFKKKRIALPNQPIDGIIGVDLLQNFEMMFNFPKHQITVLSANILPMPSDAASPTYIHKGMLPEELVSLGFAKAQSAAITKSPKDGRIYVHVECKNGKKNGSEDLLLDTGSEITTLSPSLANQLDLKPISENVQSTTFGGQKFVTTAPLDQLQVGSLILRDQMIQYSSQRAYDQNVPLSLGMDIMAKYQVLMDFTNQRVYFNLLPSTPPPFNITVKPQ